MHSCFENALDKYDNACMTLCAQGDASVNALPRIITVHRRIPGMPQTWAVTGDRPYVPATDARRQVVGVGTFEDGSVSFYPAAYYVRMTHDTHTALADKDYAQFIRANIM